MDRNLAIEFYIATSDFISCKQESNAEAKLRRKMEKVFNKAVREALDKLQETDSISEVDFKKVDAVLAGLEKDLGLAVFEEAEAVFDPANRLAAQIFRDRGFTASANTMGRIRGSVTETLRKSFIEGDGIKEAARKLEKKFKGLQQFELRRIARTETHNAQLLDKFKSHQTNDIVQFHEWITADDDRVRGNDPNDEADHVSLHETIVRVGDEWNNGLKFPGDTSGSIEEWINCRCALAPFFIPPGKIAPPGQTQFKESDLVSLAA